MEEIYGNILSTFMVGNMNIMKKRDVIQRAVAHRIRSVKTAYIDDFLSISKMEILKLFRSISRWLGKRLESF